jgi:hypothetical protein
MPENRPPLPVERERSTESATRSNGAGETPALPACSNCLTVRIHKVGIQVGPSTKGGRNVLTLYDGVLLGGSFTSFRMTWL